MRSLLPAIEPDRTSDRPSGSRALHEDSVEFFDRCRFRCEVEGVEEAAGGGLPAGLLKDAGVAPQGDHQVHRDEHPHPRPLLHDRRALLQGLPGLLGPAAEDRLRARPSRKRPPPALRRGPARPRLPEGSKGPRSSSRTATRSSGSAAEASGRGGGRARPAGPGLLVGAEEAAPVFARSRLLQKATGLIDFPLTNVPGLGPWERSATCPPSSRSASSSRSTPPECDDKALVQSVAQEVRARIEENLHEMVSRSQLVWLG